MKFFPKHHVHCSLDAGEVVWILPHNGPEIPSRLRADTTAANADTVHLFPCRIIVIHEQNSITRMLLAALAIIYIWLFTIFYFDDILCLIFIT